MKNAMKIVLVPRLLLFMTAILALTGLFGCTMDAPLDPPVNEEPTDPPPVIEVPDDPESLPIKFALYDGDTLRYWDGETLHDAFTGPVEVAGTRKLAVDDVLYYLDEKGGSVASQWLPVVPDAVLAADIGARALAYEDEIYTLETIPADVAYSFGARYKDYTRIFIDGFETGAWYLNEWVTDHAIQTASGHVLIRTAAGHWINMTDGKAVDNAYDGGILLYDMGTENGRIVDETGDYYVTWEMNYFDNSRWLKADGVWYTENGYTWTGPSGVISAANCLYGWNNYETYPETYDAPYPEKPYLLPAGVRAENGEEVTYWIETVTAKLYRHIPSIDRLDMIVELYAPPMSRMGAIPYFNSLDPVIIGDELYYHEGGSIMCYSFATGLLSVFGTDQEVIPW